MAITTGINCITSRYGTGMESCQPVEGLPVGFYLVPKGWSLNKTTDAFDSAYVDEQIQLGNFIPFTQAFEMTVATPDPTTQESQSGLTSVVRQGRPVFTAIFKKGLQFQKAAFSYNSDNEFDVIIIYGTGYVKVVESPDGTTIKGLTVGMLNTNGYGENTGTTSAQTTIMFQVVDESEYNQFAYLLTDLDFNPNAKSGVVNTLVTLTNVDNSASSATFTVKWKGNEQFNIQGLTSPNLRLVNANTDVALITDTVSYSNGVYTLETTVAPTVGQPYYVQIYDGVLPAEVAKVGNKFYEGTSNSFTAVA